MIGVSRDSTPTQVNMILREVYARENRYIPTPIGDSFSFPSNHRLRRHIVTKPPNWTKSRSDQRGKSSSGCGINCATGFLRHAPLPLYSSEEVISDKSPESRISSIEGGFQIPVDLPLTSSEMIGWVICRENRAFRRWRRPRVTGPVVKYAEIYYEQNRINPFKHRSF